MLVFISDLHFVDGSAGEHNPPTKAFEYFFDDLVSIAGKESNRIKEIKIVLLGDVFDLLRTEKWFPVDANERPWGYDEAKIEDHARKILTGILSHGENPGTFQLIRDRVKSLKDQCQQFAQCRLESEPRLFYIPGNHDRLVNKYSSLRVMACDCLGMPRQWHNPADPFPHTHDDLRYGVFARHGHEFDIFNYESGASYTLPDYERVPIGDPITTELVARLPFEADLYLQDQGMPPQERQPIKTRLQEIENVRPMGAVIEWLLYQVQQEEEPMIQQAIEAAISQAIKLFEGLNYVRLWYERHDRWTNPLDEADKIQTFLWLLSKLKLSTLSELMPLVERVKGLSLFAKDDLREAAPHDLSQLDPRFRYVVYGHTHEPLVAALRSDPPLTGDSQLLEKVYLNTGTWRSRYYQADVDHSFMSWKNMTYVIFYREDERIGRKADFETWTGSLKTV
ncbi:MAG: metallophosphoesterase family protein [Desulfobaccales bacterium]